MKKTNSDLESDVRDELDWDPVLDNSKITVTNKVEITTDPIPSDVADRIAGAFRRDAIIDDSLITVTNSGHTVYLDGTTGSWYAMDEAVDTAWQAPGVTDVVNRLVVVP